MALQIHGRETFNNSEINSPNIEGGTINNTPIGGTTPSVSNFTQLSLSKGSDVASANALTLGNDGNYFDITGTTAITSIGTIKIGVTVVLHFDGALTLTHNATDLILPSGANITTAAGDEATFVEYATGDWRCIVYTKADGISIVAKTSAWLTAEDAYLPANNPAALVEVAGATIYGGWHYLAFDDTASEHAIWRVPMPGYDGGDIVCTSFAKCETRYTGMPPSKTVFFNILTLGLSDANEFNAAVTVDTNVNIVHQFGSADYPADIDIRSATINPDNVSADELMVIEISRDVADTLVDDIQLIGILMEYNRL